MKVTIPQYAAKRGVSKQAALAMLKRNLAKKKPNDQLLPDVSHIERVGKAYILTLANRPAKSKRVKNATVLQ